MGMATLQVTAFALWQEAHYLRLESKGTKGIIKGLNGHTDNKGL